MAEGSVQSFARDLLFVLFTLLVDRVPRLRGSVHLFYLLVRTEKRTKAHRTVDGQRDFS